MCTPLHESTPCARQCLAYGKCQSGSGCRNQLSAHTLLSFPYLALPTVLATHTLSSPVFDGLWGMCACLQPLLSHQLKAPGGEPRAHLSCRAGAYVISLLVAISSSLPSVLHS